MSRVVVLVLLALAVLACKSSSSKNKNDQIAACTNTGGHWVEGGCNDDGHCEKTTGMGPSDDPVDDEAPEEADDEDAF